MSYRVQVLRSAWRELSRLPSRENSRITDRICSLGDNPRPIGSTKLANREIYRIRVGDYRVLYRVDDQNRLVTIQAVRHRREAYR